LPTSSRAARPEDVDEGEENSEPDVVVSSAEKRELVDMLDRVGITAKMSDSEERLAETFRKIHARRSPDAKPDIVGFGEPENGGAA
jgi:hypothetical protein